jgi:hypothetical protein
MLTEYHHPAAPEAAKGPTKKALASYREMIQTAEPLDTAISRNAWKSDGDAIIDRHTWEQRSAADYSLRVRVLELQAELREAQQTALAEQAIAARPAKDFPTVGELLAAIEQAIVERAPGHVTPGRIRVRELQESLADERRTAIHTLRSTSGKDTARKIQDLTSQADDLRGTIASYQKLADLEGEIERQSTLCDDLAASRNEKDRLKHREARARLAELCSLRPTVPAALAAMNESQAALAERLTKISALEESRLDPKNQVWSE